MMPRGSWEQPCRTSPGNFKYPGNTASSSDDGVKLAMFPDAMRRYYKKYTTGQRRTSGPPTYLYTTTPYFLQHRGPLKSITIHDMGEGSYEVRYEPP